jgi:hypothetical protein
MYIRRFGNYKVLCTNKTIGLGPHKSELPDEEVRELT